MAAAESYATGYGIDELKILAAKVVQSAFDDLAYSKRTLIWAPKIHTEYAGSAVRWSLIAKAHNRLAFIEDDMAWFDQDGDGWWWMSILNYPPAQCEAIAEEFQRRAAPIRDALVEVLEGAR